MNKSLKIECNIDKLKEVREFLDRELKACSVSEEQAGLMILAVDEICANLIIHSHGRDATKELEIRFQALKDAFLFEVLDSGKPFDPSSIAEPDISTIVNEKRKGGLGLMLVRRIMDSIELRNENNKTVYRLYKKI